MVTCAKVGIHKPKLYLTTEPTNSQIDTTPTNAAAALKDHQWKIAMQEEYNALMKNGTWVLVLFEPNMKVVGCKWVFKQN